MKRESIQKVIALALSAVMAWGFVACGTPSNGSSSKESTSLSSEAFSSSSEEQGSSLKGSSSSSGSGSFFSSSSSEDSSESSTIDSSMASSSDSSEDSSEFSSSSSGDSSSGSDVIEPQGAVPYDGSAVEVTFYHAMGANLRSVLDKYISKFNKLYPNITIRHTTMGDYDSVRDRIATELTGGNSPSMAYCYPEHVVLYNEVGAALTLEDYISSTDVITMANGNTETMGYTQAQLDDFIAPFYAEGKVYGDDKTYTLPFPKSTEILYYNKTFFEEYNLTVPATWDEMETVCEQIKTIDKYCIPFVYDNEPNWFITMTQQLGTPYASATADNPFLFNTPENRAFVERFTDWYQKGYFTTKEILGSYGSEIFTRTDSDRIKSYMCIGSSAGASYQCPPLESSGYPFEVGVAMLPQANPEAPAVIQQGPSLCFFKKSNPQEQAAAWLFAKYLTTSVEFQAEFSVTSGYTPVIKSATEHPIYQDFLEKADGNQYLQASVIKQSLAQVDAYFVPPAFEGSSVARDEVGKLMQICFTRAPKDGAAAFIEQEFKKTVDTLVYDYGY
ncbi:MAG: extracellular solute-binding protein [Clostridia bacterium]|nr:extracellular solute-binding protein [Clostridia bacterium]